MPSPSPIRFPYPEQTEEVASLYGCPGADGDFGDWRKHAVFTLMKLIVMDALPVRQAEQLVADIISGVLKRVQGRFTSVTLTTAGNTDRIAAELVSGD